MAGRSARAASARREQGLKKKAAELATLCAVDVCIVGRGPDGEVFFWPDDVGEVRRIAGRYLDAVRDGGGAATGRKRNRAEELVGDKSSGSFLGGKKKRTRGYDRVCSLGTDGGAAETEGGVDGGGPPLLSSPPEADTWVCRDGDLDLLAASYMMSSPSPVVMPEDSETTACYPEQQWMLGDEVVTGEDNYGGRGEQIIAIDERTVAEEETPLAVPVDPLFSSLAAAAAWTRQKRDLDLVEGLCVMMKPPLPPTATPDDLKDVEKKAIVSGGKGTAQDKIKTLRAAGVTVVESPAKIGTAMLEVFKQRGLVAHLAA